MIEPGNLSPGSTGSTAGPLGRLVLSRSEHDRVGNRRSEPGLVDRLLADPATRVIELRAGWAHVHGTGSGLTLIRTGPEAFADVPLWLYLGRHDDGTGPTEYLAAIRNERAPVEVPAAGPTQPVGAVAASAPAPGEDGWLDLRTGAPLFDDLDAGLFTTAVALANWHRGHAYCPRCGAATVVDQAGWTRRCTADGSEHYPRTDPAIIVAVVSPDDRLLLGHNPAWAEQRYSTLAGFVEPGECLEDAVRREVAEETGITVGAVTYLGSQPWPFPASLMLGFVARADSTTIDVDANEITDARWFSREDLARLIPTGDLIPPGGVSIARRLVEYWYGGPLPEGPHTW